VVKDRVVNSAGIETDWNVLTSPWLEVMDLQAVPCRTSVIAALTRATELHQIVAANPLDLFAAHRLLITLMYWKAPEVGGLEALRESLLKGKVPKAFIKALEGEAARFNLLDAKRPFMQDPEVMDETKLSASSLFAEMASGTNVAHFSHADDETSRLCLRCATLGLLRLVPWTQSGGSGKQPSLHGAPPIMAIAVGRSLCETLGLNLVPTSIPLGKPQWTGQFRPVVHAKGIQLLEALTWNPRRVHLGAAREPACCCQCGESRLPIIGPIVFKMNPACKQDGDRLQEWRDPAAFYKPGDHRTIKTSNEVDATTGDDRRRLREQHFGKKVEPAPQAAVMLANPDHSDWVLVMPCTNPAHAKSFDHRIERVTTLAGPAPKRTTQWFDLVPWQSIDERNLTPHAARRPSAGMVRFVSAAARLDIHSWGVLVNAACRSMEQDPAAFDIFTGLYWPLRTRDTSLPSRNAAWLCLKLMATAGRARPRPSDREAPFRPWLRIETAASPLTTKAYRRATPVGQSLETELREIIRSELARSPATTVDWSGLCQFVNDITP
jgi:hypothetical protein